MRAGVPWRTNCGQRKLGPVNRPRRVRSNGKTGESRVRVDAADLTAGLELAAQINKVFRRTARPGRAEHSKHFAPADPDYAINRSLYGARLHSGILGRRPPTLSDAYTFVDRAVWLARAVPFSCCGRECFDEDAEPQTI
jgi:hypothetical protein